jgi:hypothetical protein
MPAPSPDTGLTGTVLRGPIAPVCTPTAPCDAPFSATFTVEQNGRAVAQFHSDANGSFTVPLAPGDYTVKPAPDAGVFSQGQPATVLPVGYTTVTLHFDTGIR